MSENSVLRIISNETKSSIDQMSVVTPSIYASIFEKFASSHNEVIANEKELSVNLLKLECSSLTALQENTSKNANLLTKNTDKALNAIKQKDEKGLEDVLKETQQLRREIEKLKEAVYKDELTNSYNRKWLHDTYLNSDASSFNNSGTLTLIDLNYFKQVNDIHGHIIGDKVLIYIANQLKATKANVIRYGGDEFIIIFSNHHSMSYVINILEKIRENVLSKKLKAHADTFTVSFSYGVKNFTHGDDLAQIIELADKKMYKDKIKIKKRVLSI